MARLVCQNRLPRSFFRIRKGEGDSLAVGGEIERVVRATFWGDGEVEVPGNGVSQIPFGKRLVAEFFFHDARVSAHSSTWRIRIGPYADADGWTPGTNSDTHGGTDASSRCRAGEIGGNVLRSGGEESLVFRANPQGEVRRAEIDVSRAGRKDTHLNDHIALAEGRA